MASSGEIRKFFKALSENPTLTASLHGAKSVAEKHQILKSAGLTPPTKEELHAELTSSLQQTAPGATPDAETSEFVDNVLHLAAGSAMAPA